MHKGEYREARDEAELARDKAMEARRLAEAAARRRRARPEPPMTDWIARRCLVAGRVQGVFYRASTRARAEALGVTGYARNLADGRVEVLACGEPQRCRRCATGCGRGRRRRTSTAVEIETRRAGDAARTSGRIFTR